MKNRLNEMTEYEKDSFINAVEVTLDYNEPVSEEDYELYKELIKERISKEKFQEITQIIEKCKDIPQPYKGTSGEDDTLLKQGEAEIALEMGIPIYAVGEVEGYHGSDAGFHNISRIMSKEELIRYTALLSGYRNMAILQPNYPKEDQRVIADYLRDVYEQRLNNENKKYVIEESRHTKTNDKIWLVKINDKLERNDFLQEKQKMEELGGYYSKYTHSFIFKEDPSDILNENALNSQIKENTQDNMSEEEIYNNIYEYETLINMPEEERITLEQRGKGWNLERANENIKDYIEYAHKCKKYLKDNLFQINSCEEVSYYLLSDLAGYHAHPHDTVQGVKIEECDTDSITFIIRGYEHDDGSHESYSERKIWTLEQINKDLKSICLTHYWSDKRIKYLKEENQIRMIGKIEDKLEIPENERFTEIYKSPNETQASNETVNPNQVSYVLRTYASSQAVEKKYQELVEMLNSVSRESFEEWRTLGIFSQAELIHDLEEKLSILDKECITSYYSDQRAYVFKYGLSKQEIFERYLKLRELDYLSQKKELQQDGKTDSLIDKIQEIGKLEQLSSDKGIYFPETFEEWMDLGMEEPQAHLIYELESVLSIPDTERIAQQLDVEDGSHDWRFVNRSLSDQQIFDKYAKLKNLVYLSQKIEGVELGNFEWDEELYLHFTATVDGYELEGLFRTSDPQNGEDMELVSIDYGYNHSRIKEQWDNIEKFLKSYTSEKYADITKKVNESKELQQDDKTESLIDKIQEIGKLEVQYNIPNEKRITQWYGDYNMYEAKKGITTEILEERYVQLIQDNNFKLDQVSVRLKQETPLYSDKVIETAEDALKIVGQELMANLDREQICIINLNTQNNPINFSIASVGTLNNALAEPREMLKASILSNAGSVIMLHNHPSGNYYPSLEDYQVTERIIKSFDSVGIKVLDHVIIAGNNIDDYYSMREENVKMFEESPVLTGKLEFSDISEHLLHKINVFLVAEDLSYWINNTHSTISLTNKEAELILNYMDGHGYNLGVENGSLVRIDQTEDEPTAEEYNINEAIYIVCDWNSELISDTNENINAAASVEEVCKLREYMKALRADESVIDTMFKKTSLGKTLELGAERQEEKKTEHKKEKVI